MNLNRIRSTTSAASPPQVWAVDHGSAQLTWGWLGDDVINVRIGPQIHTISQPPGPGSLRVTDLKADHRYDVEISGERGRLITDYPLTFRTPPRPPGELLFQLATISDMHLGARRWGFFKTMTELTSNPPAATSTAEFSVDDAVQPAIVAGKPPGPYRQPHPIRCAGSAVHDAVAWGTELLVIKGDSVQHENAECYRLLDDLVDDKPELPMMAIPGNHDVDGNDRFIPEYIGQRKLPICRDVEYQDQPGIRVVVGDTTIPGRGKGTVAGIESALLDAVSESDRPVLIFTHQQFQPGKVARHWPIGITAPESTDFLDRLQTLNKPVVMSSGHTHRNRVRRHGSILLTEVGSTKDWPCVWAGYNVFEGGIEQAVYRVSEQSAMAWAEYSRQAVGGLWAKWSPGRLTDRCVREVWSAR